MLVLSDDMTEAEKLAQLEPLVTGPYNQFPDGRIDCIFDIPKIGPSEYTADPADEYEHCRLIHQICSERIAGGAEHTTDSYNVLPPVKDPVIEMQARIARLEAMMEKLQ